MQREKSKNLSAKKSNQRGFTLIEVIIVGIVIAILAAIAIPQIVGVRRMIRYEAVPRTIMTEARFARQQAMSQQAIISFMYDDAAKLTRIYGGTFGAQGALTNRVSQLTGDGLTAADITYGIPTGAPVTPLGDTTTITVMPGTNQIVINFYPDGVVRDPANSNIVTNYALFIYGTELGNSSAAAVSVLGSSGRVKLWRYNASADKYLD